MKATITILLLLAMIACSTTKVYMPGTANVDKREKATLAELQQGHDIYVKSCKKCHGLKNPESRSPEQWTKILDKMAPKAKLNAEQKSLVYKYVVNY